MKKILLILLAGSCLLACKTGDKKTDGNSLSNEEREKALKDSSNFTSIQWLDSTFLDLGKIPEGKVVEVAFRFRNTGNKPLVIADVTASCGCTVPEKPDEAFPTGKEGEIKAKFDSRGRPHGENQKTVTVTANTNPSYHLLTFRVEITD